MSASDFALLSTTRFDPRFLDLPWNTQVNDGLPSPFFLLAYHRDRLLDAAQTHDWTVSQDKLVLSNLEALCHKAVRDAENTTTPRSCRVRILLSRGGVISVIASPTAPLPYSDPMSTAHWLPSDESAAPPSPNLELLTVYLDMTPTPSSVFTRTKTTYRDHYNAARDRFKLPPPPTAIASDVVLYNEAGDVTETSIRNIAFVRRTPPCWVTPSISTGCLAGVARRWLLQQGRIVESNNGELRRDDIIDGEYVLTFNGVEGCRVGRIQVTHL